MGRFSFISTRTVLCICMLLAAVFGCLAGCNANEMLLSVMRMALESPVSIVCLFVQLFLPFLLSIFAVTTGRVILLALIAGLKMFSFLFCLTCVFLMIRTGESPNCLFLMFQDICLMPLLSWFWLKTSSCCNPGLLQSVLVSVVIILGIIFVDYLCISPLLV